MSVAPRPQTKAKRRGADATRSGGRPQERRRERSRALPFDAARPFERAPPPPAPGRRRPILRMSAEPLAVLLRSLGVRTCLLTDAEGAVLLRAGTSADSDADVLELQRMAATYAQSAEHAGKLGLGKNATATAFYGECERVWVGGRGILYLFLELPHLSRGLPRPSLAHTRAVADAASLVRSGSLSCLSAFRHPQTRPLLCTSASRLSCSPCCSPRATTPTSGWCSTASRS